MNKNDEFILFSRLANLSVRNAALSVEQLKEVRTVAGQLGSDRLMELTNRAKMLPFLAKLLVQAQVDIGIWMPLLEQYRTRNGRVIAALAEVYAQFKLCGVRKAFVSENFGALLAAGSDTGLFASGDVDCFVDPSERERIDAAFHALGYGSEERYTGGLLLSAEYTHEERLPEGFSFGINYFPLSRLTLPCFIDTEQFVDWQRLRLYKDTDVVLPPADALMYICLLHISLHSFCRAPAIRLYRDIVNAGSSMTGDDWSRLLGWAQRDKVLNRLSTAAFLANDIAAAGLPQELVSLSGGRNAALLSACYDKNHGVLKPEPSRLSVLRIEAQCSDKGALSGMHAILAPEKVWLRQVYGSSGITAGLRHLKRIL